MFWLLQSATTAAEVDLPPTHPIRFGLALNFLCFLCYSLSLNLLFLHLSLLESSPLFLLFFLFRPSCRRLLAISTSCRQVAAYNSNWVRVFTATHSPSGISFFLFLFLFLSLQLTQGFETLNMKREENLRLRHVGLFFGFLVILSLPFFALFCFVVTAKCRIAYQVSNICHSLIGGFQLPI